MCMPPQNKSVTFSHSGGDICVGMFGLFLLLNSPRWVALKTLGPSIINIYHSHILPSIILLTGMKFCYPLKKMRCCLFIQTGAPQRGIIFVPRPPCPWPLNPPRAMTSSTTGSCVSGMELMQSRSVEMKPRHLNQLINAHFIIDGAS